MKTIMLLILPFFFCANASTDGQFYLGNDNYFDKCRGNVNFEELVECAAFKGIEVSNGGHGVSDSVSQAQLDAISPSVLGCINLYLNITKVKKLRRSNHALVLANIRALHSSEFRTYSRSIVIPVNTESVYMEDVRNGYYGYYEIANFSVKECAKYLSKNRAL